MSEKKIMDYDEIWDEKIKEIIGDEQYDNFKDTLRKISVTVQNSDAVRSYNPSAS